MRESDDFMNVVENFENYAYTNKSIDPLSLKICWHIPEHVHIQKKKNAH